MYVYCHRCNMYMADIFIARQNTGGASGGGGGACWVTFSGQVSVIRSSHLIVRPG